jgi:hypothetical protein
MPTAIATIESSIGKLEARADAQDTRIQTAETDLRAITAMLNKLMIGTVLTLATALIGVVLQFRR